MFLGPKGEVEEYAVISIHPSAPISRELRLDHQEKHLYILTSNMVTIRWITEVELVVPMLLLFVKVILEGQAHLLSSYR